MRRFQDGLPLAAVLVCAAWAGTALGQGRPPGLPPEVPYIAPPQVPQVQIPPIEIPPPTYQGPTEEQIRRWQEDEDRRRAAIAQVYKYAGPPHDPASDYPSHDQFMLGMEIALTVLVIVLLGWAALRAYARHARPTDPMKYVMSDPWVRAHLTRNGGSSGQAPQEPPV